MSSQPRTTVGVDIGDRYSHLCLLDTETGDVVEEARIATNPAALESIRGLRADANRDRGGHPLPVDQQAFGGARPPGPRRQRPQVEAHLRRGQEDG